MDAGREIAKRDKVELVIHRPDGTIRALTTETDSELATPAFDALDDRDRKFVEARAAGMTGVESAKYAGCDAPTHSGLATFAKRATKRTAAALEEMIAATAIDEASLVESLSRACARSSRTRRTTRRPSARPKSS